MKLYDAHIHFFFKSSVKTLQPAFRRLTETGLTGFDALVFAEFPQDLEKILKMVPAAYHGRISLEALERQRDPFPFFASAGPLQILPYVDARFIVQNIDEKMARFSQQGYQGLKLLYIPEEDPALQVQGMKQAFGRSVRKSEEVTAQLIDSAAARGMRVLFHVDLRRYGGFAEEMVRSHPQTNFNIPHFGSSRKALIKFLDAYPNCYTDTSSLMPYMREAPAAYRDFIRQHQDQILFGSDALIGTPGVVATTLRFMKQLLNDEELFQKLTCKNYLAFHKIQ